MQQMPSSLQLAVLQTRRTLAPSGIPVPLLASRPFAGGALRASVASGAHRAHQAPEAKATGRLRRRAGRRAGRQARSPRTRLATEPARAAQLDTGPRTRQAQRPRSRTARHEGSPIRRLRPRPRTRQTRRLLALQAAKPSLRLPARQPLRSTPRHQQVCPGGLPPPRRVSIPPSDQPLLAAAARAAQPTRIPPQSRPLNGSAEHRGQARWWCHCGAAAACQ
mmetsp:Transcript_26568/g.99992  ORF Transcript_26568/g.99992 Transcript_26568/m.99992 type:complete len:221 (+) Transcript_26568:364-1026(+)